jgi:hypothetical protein
VHKKHLHARNIYNIFSIVAEWVFRGKKYNTSGNIVNIVVIQAVKLLDFKNLFNDLNDHILEQDPVNNHAVQLVYIFNFAYIFYNAMKIIKTIKF